MKNALKVFMRDLKSIVKNPVAIIIVLGICIIPSLYAWVNIEACWDPYESTSTIPIAVVNSDKGTVLEGEELNVGNEIVEELKHNDKIGWKFVNSKEASLGIVDGTYYATIEITESFSEDLVSILGDNPVKPIINYKVQTKSNPVAVKIAGAAKNSLIDEVTAAFLSTATETIFSKVKKVEENFSGNKEKIIDLKDYIITLDKNIDIVISLLSNVNGNATNVSKYLNDIQSTIPQLISGIELVTASTENTDTLITNTQLSLNNSIENIVFNLSMAESSLERLNNMLGELDGNDSNVVSEFNMLINNSIRELDTINNSVGAVIVFLQDANTTNPKGDIANTIVLLNSLKDSINSEKTKLSTIQKDLASGSEDISGYINSLSDEFDNIKNNIIKAIENLNSDVNSQLEEVINYYIKATEDASYLIDKTKGLQSEIQSFLKLASEGTSLTAEVSGDLVNKLKEYKEIISDISSKLKIVDNESLVEVITILQSNPRFMGEFISDSVTIKDDPIYKIPNYGSAMTPVYSVLALWVGGLMLTAVLKTQVAYFEGIENTTIRQRYFGKMLLFILLAAIQGLIVSIGNVYLLGVYTVNPLLMISFAVVTSITFVIIIYTLVAIFGNVGKALSIIFMIIQLAGSGGTYPIQLDPKFFRILKPFFPFAYSVGGFREAIAGPLAEGVILDFVALFITSIIFIVFGFIFKKPLDPLVTKFEKKFKESGVAE